MKANLMMEQNVANTARVLTASLWSLLAICGCRKGLTVCNRRSAVPGCTEFWISVICRLSKLCELLVTECLQNAREVL